MRSALAPTLSHPMGEGDYRTHPCTRVLAARTACCFALLKPSKTFRESQRDSVSKPRVASSASYPGNGGQLTSNPSGVCASSLNDRPHPHSGLETLRFDTQGSAFRATLGFESESLWDSHRRSN